MESDWIHLERQAGVATLTLNRTRQLNALNREFLQQIEAQLEILKSDEQTRVVLLQGAGKAFAAGADIEEMRSLSPEEAESFSRFGQKVFKTLEDLPQPTIALVHGYALGGGLELAMACDIRFFAEGTRVGQPEVTLGIIPGFGGSQRLPRVIGQGPALRWLLTGELLEAQRALQLGLAHEVWPAGELQEKGIKIAQKIASLPPASLRFIKQAVYQGWDSSLEEGLAIEAKYFGRCFATQDQKEGMSAFLEKRTAYFTGR